MSVKVASVYKCPDGTDFPVEWDEPEDERYGWFWDQMHCPLPLKPLSQGFWQDILIGFDRTGEVIGSPGFSVRMSVHGYSYSRSAPYRDHQDVRAAVARMDAEKRVDQVLELWESRYRPEVEVITWSLRSLATAGLSLRQLVDRLDQVHAARRRHGELHMLVMGPAGTASNRFIDFCVSEFGAEGESIAGDLTQGFPNKSLESAAKLWGLSREALLRPAVEELIRTAPVTETLERLPSVFGGKEFAGLLRRYLEEYGWRNESFSELSFPSWREEPRFPLFIIRRYLDASDAGSPMALNEKVARRREERQREIERRFSGDPEKLERFRSLLRSAQQRTVLLEDHNFYIDQQGPTALRAILMAMADALVGQGAIDRREDVFYLFESELADAAANSDHDFRVVVQQRRSERDRWLRVLPPSAIGEGAVAMPLPMQRFFGPLANEPMEAGAFRGMAGSPGKVRGTARLILTLDDVDRLAPGEILVTYATAPPWTPLFAIAGGVVTDIGGALSHCAVVAREYGIPAVVGTRVATRTIEDGMLITVDGTSGTVRIEE